MPIVMNPASSTAKPKKQVESLSRELVEHGISALPYHADLDSETRRQNQEAFINGDTRGDGRNNMLLVWGLIKRMCASCYMRVCQRNLNLTIRRLGAPDGMDFRRIASCFLAMAM